MPAYGGSESFSGAGSILAINTGTATTPVYTPIGECTKANLTGRNAKVSDCTSFSSGKVSEFLAVMVDSGSIDLTCNYVSSDAGQIQLQSSFSALAKTLFKLTLPLAPNQVTTSDSYSFAALVTDFSFDVGTEKQIEITSKLKISGLLNFSAGA